RRHVPKCLGRRRACDGIRTQSSVHMSRTVGVQNSGTLLATHPALTRFWYPACSHASQMDNQTTRTQLTHAADASLIAMAKVGDEAAMDQLVGKYWIVAYRVAVRILRS